MKIQFAAASLLAYCLASSLAHGSITLDLEAADLQTAATNGTDIPDGSLIFLVAYTGANAPSPADFVGAAAGSFSGLVYGNTPVTANPSPTVNTVWGNAGSSDIIVWEGAANTQGLGFGVGGVQQTISATLSNGWAAGDPLALFWFNTPYNTSGTTNIMSGMTYGYFTDGETVTSGGSPWTTPSDGSTVDVDFLTGAAGGSASPSGFATIAGSPVPEPADFAALGGVFSLGLVALRRRKNRSA